MTDNRSGTTARIPGPRARVTAEHLLIESLGSVAGAFLGPGAGDAERADLLAEVFVAVRLHAGLARGVYPPRGTVAPRSRAAADLEVVLAAAVRHYRAVAGAASATFATVLPADLQVTGARVGADLQPGGSSEADEITLREAAALLGLKSTEWVRQLIDRGEVDGWQEEGRRKRWHVTRASVIGYRERRDGGHGLGGGEGRVA